MTKRTLTLGIILSLILGNTLDGFAAGQGVSATPDGGAWNSLSAVPPGDDLVVQLKNNQIVKGRLHAVSDAGLTLSRGNRTTDIRRDEVARVQRITGGSVSKATAIGAGIGGAAGAAVGGGLGGALTDGGAAGTVVGVAFVFSGLGAGIGAGVGAITGLVRKKRVLIYQAP